MAAIDDDRPIDEAEGARLFASLARTPLALAVSGGADSLALMHLVARWAQRPEVRSGYAESWRRGIERRMHALAPIPVQGAGLVPPPWLADICSAEALARAGGPPQVVVLTVDHGLRPEAAREAAFVAAEAGRLGLPCLILSWQGPKPATGLQVAAREARRRLLLDVVRAEAALLSTLAAPGHHAFGCGPWRALVMAHHRDDQAETVLMRLARGSGLDGLGGMREREPVVAAPTRERPTHFETDILRPLLEVPKARLVATLRALGATWVEDPSNQDDRFERVRLRKALASLGEAGVPPAMIALSARRLREAAQGIGELWRAQDPTLGAEDRIGPAFGEVVLDGTRFLSRYVLVRTLRWLLRLYGGAAAEAELAQLEELATLCLDQIRRQASGGLTLAGCKLEFQGPNARRLRVYREGGGEGLPVIAIAPGGRVDWDGRRFCVTAQKTAAEGAVVRAMGLADWASIKRELPALGELGLPAQAVATLPVVEAAGEVIAWAGLDEALAGLRTPQTIRDALRAHGRSTGRDYFSGFQGASAARW